MFAARQRKISQKGEEAVNFLAAPASQITSWIPPFLASVHVEVLPGLT